MKQSFQKLTSLLLALFLLLCLAGCGDLSETLGAAQEIYDVATDLYDALEDPASSEDATEPLPEPSSEETTEPLPEPSPEETPSPIDENGSYTTKEDVALYLYTYGKLPNNFVTKAEARELGWEGGSLEPYLPGCCIGGDSFGNREGLLPTADGRKYTECDIDTLGQSSRGAKRIVFSNDGLIYYTDDHYESFTLLYGEE